MWRFLLLLLVFFTDYRTIPEIAHCAFTAGAATVSFLCSISVCLVLRYRLARRGD